MGEQLERIYGYRLLIGKRDGLAIALTTAEAVYLERLADILPSGMPALEPDRAEPSVTALPVRIMLRGRLAAGTLMGASADGLAIALEDPPGLGERGVVYVSESQHGIEYRFPGRVIARVLRGVAAVGWAFDGVPAQTRLGRRGSGVWRPEAAFEEELPTTPWPIRAVAKR